jgi:hypothetical protein
MSTGQRRIVEISDADEDYGRHVAAHLGIDTEEALRSMGDARAGSGA